MVLLHYIEQSNCLGKKTKCYAVVVMEGPLELTCRVNWCSRCLHFNWCSRRRNINQRKPNVLFVWNARTLSISATVSVLPSMVFYLTIQNYSNQAQRKATQNKTIANNWHIIGPFILQISNICIWQRIADTKVYFLFTPVLYNEEPSVLGEWAHKIITTL